MAKSTRKRVNTCELCCGIISKSFELPDKTSQLKIVNHLWSYLYHQNVKEALLSSTSLSATETDDTDNDNVPKLTFSLTVGTAIKSDTEKVPIKICKECIVELEMLDKLHQQLESVKNLINCQVNKIKDKRLENEATQGSKRTRKKDSLLDNIQPQAGMNFAGCSIGKDNISQTLIFLSTICDGLSSSLPPSIPIPTTEAQKPKKTKIENLDELVCLVDEPEMNRLDVSLSNDVPDEKIEKALDIEIGEEFVSIVKMEPDLDKVGDLQVPEKDPLEIQTGAPVKPKRKYEKRPEYNGKGPRFLPCKSCKTKVFRWNWESHQKWHKGEKQFKCELCDERFTQKRSLSRHKRWHQRENWQHECDRCGKRYLFNYKLVVHQKKCKGVEVT